MSLAAQPVWLLALCATAVAAWWLTLRPGPAPRRAPAAMPLMIVALALLLGVLALNGQTGPRRANAAPHVSIGQ